MNEIDISKYSDIINKKEVINHNNSFSFINKVFLSFIILMSTLILYKSNIKCHNFIDKYILEDSIPFVRIKGLYDKYLGGLLPIKKEVNVTSVFDEKLVYDNLSIYKDGIVLDVEDNYLVPSLCEGMVTFIGEKEGYGPTIIVESIEGIEYWYGNINSNVKLYDYIEKGSYIGEVSNKLYLVFTEDGKYLNYEDFI